MSIISQNAFFNPSVNLFGQGTVNEVGTRLSGLGVKKALLVSDAGLNAIGLVDQVAGIIREAGVEVAIFAKAEPNPTDKNVAEGLDFYFAEKCDGIVTLGGGSSHDAGKGIGLVAANGGTIHDYEGLGELPRA
jgi:alcohol dehydrogenase